MIDPFGTPVDTANGALLGKPLLIQPATRSGRGPIDVWHDSRSSMMPGVLVQRSLRGRFTLDTGPPATSKFRGFHHRRPARGIALKTLTNKLEKVASTHTHGARRPSRLVAVAEVISRSL